MVHYADEWIDHLVHNSIIKGCLGKDASSPGAEPSQGWSQSGSAGDAPEDGHHRKVCKFLTAASDRQIKDT